MNSTASRSTRRSRIGKYKRLAALAEDAEDIRAFDEARTSDEDLIPAETVHRLIERDNPIKVLGISRAHANPACEGGRLQQSYIAMLERCERQGPVVKLRMIAKALAVDVDDLLPVHD